MHSQLRQRAIDLRTTENLSYGAICNKLGVAKSTLSYWLKEYPLTKERILELRRAGWSKGEASREKFRITMREKRLLKENIIYDKAKLKFGKLSKDSIFTAGLMLYLAEGTKRDVHRIVLANTDPRIIKFFIKWMTEFLNIPKGKMKAELHLYDNMNITEEIGFWKKQLGFKDNQLYKTQIRKWQKSSFSYKESFRHGTCKIHYGGVEKKTELTMTIKAFVDLYLGK